MKRLVASLFAVSLLCVVSSAEVHAVDCDAASATYLPVSAAPQPIFFYGDSIGEEQMAALWDLGMKWNTHDFGKAIAAGQNWFGECKYPGIGLGTGSGYSWHDRNVTLWIWADGVDLAQAVSTIHSLVQPAPTTTTTTIEPTTTTTEPEPTTTTVALVVTTTTQAPEPESIAVVQVLDEPVSFPPTATTTTTTVAPSIAASASVVIAPAVEVVLPAVQKKVVKKIVKKKVVKKKVKVKVNGNR